MNKFLKGVLALGVALSLVACSGGNGGSGENQGGSDETMVKGFYQIFNVTGERVTELYIYENGQDDKGENYAGEGLRNGSFIEVDKGEDVPESKAHGLYTLEFKTEGGYEGKFETLSQEEAPISLLAEDDMTGETQIAFEEPKVKGLYQIYNVTGEKVTDLYMYVNGESDKGENLAGEGLRNGSFIEVDKGSDVPMSEAGHRYTLEFKTEGGYEGKFETLSQEEAPIALLAEDDMTGETQIAFQVPMVTGFYQIFNVTGEKVTDIYMYVNGESDKGENLAGEEGLRNDSFINVDKGSDVPMDQASHRYTLEFKTESGYEGKFETLSQEEAPISLLAEDDMTGETQIAFREPTVKGEYEIHNVTGETVKELYIYVNGDAEKGENYAGDGLAPNGEVTIDKGDTVPMSMAHGLYTLEFVTESGYVGTFETLSQEVAPIYLLSEDGMTGETMISFREPE